MKAANDTLKGARKLDKKNTSEEQLVSKAKDKITHKTLKRVAHDTIKKQVPEKKKKM